MGPYIYTLRSLRYFNHHKRVSLKVNQQVRRCLSTERQYKAAEETVLPGRAQVVIAGAGLVGNSIAYHLVQQGWRDIVILDKGDVADGRSKYSHGCLGMFRPTPERQVVKYCLDMYQDLQDQGYPLGLEHCGSLNLATTPDRMVALKRRMSRYKPTGMECHLLSPGELSEKHPYLNTEGVLGGVWVPEDATANAGNVSEVLAFLASQGGARYVSGCEVRRIVTEKPTTPTLFKYSGTNPLSNVRVTGVETDIGSIDCEYFVNCAGLWARQLGGKTSTQVRIPICPAEAFYLTFVPIEELSNTQLPQVTDYDSNIYVRQYGSTFMMGAFERIARPWQVSKHPVAAVDQEWGSVREEHWIHMEPYIRAAIHRFPILRETHYGLLQNRPSVYTPDGQWILGESSEVKNYFVCAGMNGNSLQAAGGVGKMVADWMVSGRPQGNMTNFDVQRFGSLHNNSKFLQDRAAEVPGRHFAIYYPLVSEFTHGRKIRSSPIYSELEARGGVFKERAGWERVLYFDPWHNSEDVPAELPPGTFGKPDFLEQIEEEYLACRDGVGIIDNTSYSKLIIKGDQHVVVEYLQKVCASDIDVPVGGVVSSGMMNQNGGYENNCLLIRREKGEYLVISPSQQQTRILKWMESHLPGNNKVALQDVTSKYTIISLVGPKSKSLMQNMTGTDMSMPTQQFRRLNVGYVNNMMVVSVNNTGEPGYSLYIPSEFALLIYHNLMKVGYDYGIKNVGLLATKFLRIEKCVPFWGSEQTCETTPNEILTDKITYKEHDFIGKAALLREQDHGVPKLLVQFHLLDFNKDEDGWPWGGEPIYRNGEYVGSVTSTAYGFTLQKMLALGFIQNPRHDIVHHDWVLDKDSSWHIDIAGKWVPVSVHIHALKLEHFQTSLDDYQKKKKKYPVVNIFEK